MSTEYHLVTLIAQDNQETFLGSIRFCLTTGGVSQKFLELFTWDTRLSSKEAFINFCQENHRYIKPLNRVKFPIKIKNYLQGIMTCDNVASYLDARIEAGF